MSEEKKQPDYYSCYKYYNDKKRRLSCFGRKINDTELEMFVWECDRKDTFTKYTAKTAYQCYLDNKKVYPSITTRHIWGSKVEHIEFKEAHPTIFTIPLNGLSPKMAFLTYLRENYRKAYPVWKIVRYNYLTDKQVEEIWQNNDF